MHICTFPQVPVCLFCPSDTTVQALLPASWIFHLPAVPAWSSLANTQHSHTRLKGTPHLQVPLNTSNWSSACLTPRLDLWLPTCWLVQLGSLLVNYTSPPKQTSGLGKIQTFTSLLPPQQLAPGRQALTCGPAPGTSAEALTCFTHPGPSQ